HSSQFSQASSTKQQSFQTSQIRYETRKALTQPLDHIHGSHCSAVDDVDQTPTLAHIIQEFNRRWNEDLKVNEVELNQYMADMAHTRQAPGRIHQPIRNREAVNSTCDV